MDTVQEMAKQQAEDRKDRNPVQAEMEPHSYVEIPKNIAEKIIAERGRKDD